MFDGRFIDDQFDINLDTGISKAPAGETYAERKARAERDLRESLSKLPRWRRKIIETALNGGW